MGKNLLGERARQLFGIDRPFAITMWDFSWLERRWPGAGYEDWDAALGELTDRGYDAVRIDAYPHLVAEDIEKEWTLKPVWNLQTWGAPAVTRVCLKDDFREFLRACRRNHVRVGLSTWFRVDPDKTLMKIKTPEDHAQVWVKTLDKICEWNELDNILYVDLCNEFPLSVWAPFLPHEMGLHDEACANWMKAAVAEFKKYYPDIPVTFSFSSTYDEHMDVSYLDFLEPHMWMPSVTDFYERIGYNYERFDDIGYTNLALKGEKEYRDRKEYYDNALKDGIALLARWAERSGKPLVTTECWSIVDYKDWPLLNWGWILDLNRIGVETAAKTGCWAGIATSNFCGPQFVGMWREKLWHKEMTATIHSAKLGE